MTKQVQRRRGTATQHTSFTGAEGELSVNTTNKSVHVHDGSTAGGIELARKDGSNVAFTSGTLDGVTIGGTTAGAGTFTNLTATGTTTLAGASTSANITFGDNDKAIFGAGSDLQIYHDGTHSYIQDSGTGNLYLRSNGNAVVIDDGTNNLAAFNATSGESALYYGGSGKKLATTSTGVDVTGTVTADGLTVDTSQGTISATDSSLEEFVVNASNYTSIAIHSDRNTSGQALGSFAAYGKDSASSDVLYGRMAFEIEANTAGLHDGSIKFQTVSDAVPYDRLKVDDNGDISFYEDTGTTAKFFWDASAESLGIGTSSPAAALHVDNGAGTRLFVGTANNIYYDGYDHIFRTPSGASTSMTIANTGNVGIGQAPSNFSGWTTLEIKGGSNGAMLNFEDSSSARVAAVASASDRLRIQTFVAEPITLETNNTERMRITSSGSVGIGTSSPSSQDASANNFVIHDTTGNGGLTIVTPTNAIGGIHFSDGTSGADRYRGIISYSHSENSMRFHTDTARAMTIDSSGNLLVGKTSAGSADGVELLPSGQVAATRDSNPPLFLRRDSSDGDMAEFYKGTAKVGSIGSSAGTNRLFIGGGDTGVRFAGDLDTIVPWNTNNTLRDAAIDLGEPTGRFKDLYLSGGVYLGGTGSANKLDDYEEGTWTASLHLPPTGVSNLDETSGLNRYTKVGNFVTVQGKVTLNTNSSSGSTFRLSGLPFTTSSNTAITGSMIVRNGANFDFTPYVFSNSAEVHFYQSGTTGNWNQVQYSEIANLEMHFEISYFAA